MVYEWGTKPTYTGEEAVGEDHTFQKHEWGMIRAHTFRHLYSTLDQLLGKIPSEKKFAETYMEKLREKGAEVKYIRVRKEGVPLIGFFELTFTVEECIFVGDPFPIIAWIVIESLIVLGIVIVVLYRPVIYKLLGMSPEEALKYELGTSILPLIIVIGLVAIALIFVKWK